MFGSIIVDSQDAIKDLNKADKQARENAKSLQKVQDGAKAMGKALVVGAGLAVTALTGMAVKSAEATDRVDKLSQKIGLSRQGFQEWVICPVC